MRVFYILCQTSLISNLMMRDTVERMNCIKLCSGCGDQTVDSSQTMSYWSVVSASNFLRNIAQYTQILETKLILQNSISFLFELCQISYLFEFSQQESGVVEILIHTWCAGLYLPPSLSAASLDRLMMAAAGHSCLQRIMQQQLGTVHKQRQHMRLVY